MREDAVVVLSLLFSLSLFMLAFFLNTTMLIHLNGYSMSPNLTDGDVVLCHKYTPDIDKGDIISFEKPGKNMTVMHRVHERISYSAFRTKGDNNSYVDPYVVPRENIRCRYVMTLPVNYTG